MLTFKHATHLIGHILASAIRLDLPKAEVLQSKDLNGRFWVDVLTSEKIIDSHLNRWRLSMDSVLQNAKLFKHTTLQMEEIESLFPSQNLKLQEAQKMAARFNGIVPAYILDSHLDFCSCEVKDLNNLKEIESVGIKDLTLNDSSTFTSSKVEGNIYRVNGLYESDKHAQAVGKTTCD